MHSRANLAIRVRLETKIGPASVAEHARSVGSTHVFVLVHPVFPILNDGTLSSPARILLIMGVAGSGKTTVGKRIAATLNWPYFEADDFHSAANKEKMGKGIPLDDYDRAPWLAAIRAKMDECRASGKSAVFTCSALKEKYRVALLGETTDATLVFLSGDFETVMARVGGRKGHYMKSDMVRSQFEALEPPKDALTLDIKLTPEEIVQTILAHLRAVSDPSPQR